MYILFGATNFKGSRINSELRIIHGNVSYTSSCLRVNLGNKPRTTSWPMTLPRHNCGGPLRKRCAGGTCCTRRWRRSGTCRWRTRTFSSSRTSAPQINALKVFLSYYFKLLVAICHSFWFICFLGLSYSTVWRNEHWAVVLHCLACWRRLDSSWSRIEVGLLVVCWDLVWIFKVKSVEKLHNLPQLLLGWVKKGDIDETNNLRVTTSTHYYTCSVVLRSNFTSIDKTIRFRFSVVIQSCAKQCCPTLKKRKSKFPHI